MSNPKITELIPFRKQITQDDDMRYNFLFKGANGEYETEITIDELNDDKIIKITCQCKYFVMKPQNFAEKPCKHVERALQLLKEHNINYELPDKDTEQIQVDELPKA